MLKLTPSHIIALVPLVFTIFCSTAAILALSFAALHVLPNSSAIVIFKECASAGFATAVLTSRIAGARQLRRRAPLEVQTPKANKRIQETD
jgi:hypothetical protein